MVGLPARQAGRVGEAAVVGEISRVAYFPRSIRRVGPAPDLVSVALHRRADDRGGGQRTRVRGDRRLWQADAEAAWRAAAARGAVEVRLQVDQIDQPFQLQRSAPAELLASLAGVGIRLLGERQSR